MPMQLMQVEEAPRDTRMTLVRDEFLNEYGGRLRAGTVVLVSEATARKWRGLGIAIDSAITDKTLKEQKLAALQALQDEIEGLDQPPELNGPLYRALAPSEREQIAARLAPNAQRGVKRKPTTRTRRAKTAPSPVPPTNDGDGQD